MIVAGIGSKKGVGAAEVVAAVEAALREHGLERSALAMLATTKFKRGEAGIFEAGEMMGLEVVVVGVSGPLTRPPLRSATLSPSGRGDLQRLRQPSEIARRQPRLPNGEKVAAKRPDEGATISLQIAGVASVSEAAALAAAGEGARLAGPRLAVGRVTCAIAFGGGA